MSRALNDLAPVFRPFAFELLARAAEAGIPCFIVDTLRTEAQQAVNVSTGHSWVTHSKHQDGLAIDLCPYLQYDANGPDKLAWNADDPNWAKLGAIGKALGLRWGGDWQQKDLGHFEYVAPASGAPGTSV